MLSREPLQKPSPFQLMRSSFSTPVLAALFVLAGCGDGSVTDVDAPPGAVSGLAARVEGGAVAISWNAPDDPRVTGTLLARFPAAGVDASPEAGRVYQPGDAIGGGRVVYAGTAREVVDVPPCAEQVYAAWARDAAGGWSATPGTVRVAELRSAPIPDSPPSGLAASVQGGRVALSWVPASDLPGDFVRIVRGSEPPSGPAEGETVYLGPGGAFADTTAALSPLETVHYAAYSCNSCGECGSEPTHAALTPSLVESLTAGGFVIYWRHATATVCDDRLELGTATSTTQPQWWRSCDRDCPPGGSAVARQLSELGYEEADSIGTALRARGIPFGRVLSSEFCRCTQTAERMALGPMIELMPEITFFAFDEANRCAASQALVAIPPARRTNTAIISHIGFPQNCPVLSGLLSGEAAIYRPDGAGGTQLIARVLAFDWADLD